MKGGVRRIGFTLLEVLIVMATMGVLFLLGSAILTGAVQMQRASAMAQEHVTQRAVLADLFRADVHEATSTPDRAATWTAGPRCLILQRSQGKQLVYQWKDDRIVRTELPAGTEQRLPVGAENASVEFVRPGADHRTVTLRLTRTWPKKASTRTDDIVAALGGEPR
jgi:type II secretory pathway pseudopilin PulG